MAMENSHPKWRCFLETHGTWWIFLRRRVPFGKLSVCYGKSPLQNQPFLLPCSIAVTVSFPGKSPWNQHFLSRWNLKDHHFFSIPRGYPVQPVEDQVQSGSAPWSSQAPSQPGLRGKWDFNRRIRRISRFGLKSHHDFNQLAKFMIQMMIMVFYN